MEIFKENRMIEDYSIEKIFKRNSNKLSDIELIIKIFEIILYYEKNSSIPVLELFKTLDLANFIAVMDILQGKTFKVPAKSVIREDLTLAVVFFYKELKNKSWDDIKKMFDFDISSVRYTSKLKNLENFIKQKISEFTKKETI